MPASRCQLLRAASQSANEQRLLVWDRDPAVERLIEQTNYAGAHPDRPDAPSAGWC